MQREILKEVWKIRFQKMLKLEEEAVELYTQLLEEHEELFQCLEIDTALEEILRDEKKHVKIAQSLCRIAKEIA